MYDGHMFQNMFSMLKLFQIINMKHYALKKMIIKLF